MKLKDLNIREVSLAGGEKGVLLAHGFTGTPECMEYLAKKLNGAGFTVLVPMLAGHGTHWKNLEKTSWEDWYHSVEKAFHSLRSRCRVVMVAGLSMGGLLAAHLCYCYPGEVQALGLLATPIFLDGFLIKGVFPAIWKTPLKTLYRSQKKYISSIKDPRAARHYRAYDRIPVAGVAELLELQKVVRNELKHLTVPTIIMHSLYDQTVPYANLDYIKAMIASREVKTVTLKRSDHIITLDYEKDLVAKELISFFQKN